MKRILLAIAIISLFFFIECKKDSTGYTPSCSGAAKSYKTDVQPLIQSYCASCHAQFSSYSQMKSNSASIRSRIVSGSMPKNASMSTDEKNKIVCWIDNGCLNN